MELNRAAAEYGSQRFGLDIRACDVEELAAEGERFDVITLTQVLEHLSTNPTAVMTTLVNMLRPGGAVIIEVPNYQGFWARVLGASWPSWGVTQHLWHFTPRTVGLVAQYARDVALGTVTARRCVDYYTVLPEGIQPLKSSTWPFT